MANKAPAFENKNPEDIDLLRDFNVQPEGGVDLLQEFGLEDQKQGDLLSEFGVEVKDEEPSELVRRLRMAGRDIARVLRGPDFDLADLTGERTRVLRQMPGEVIPGTQEMAYSAGAAGAEIQQQQLAQVKELVLRFGTATPPTPKEMEVFKPAQLQYYLTQANLFKDDPAMLASLAAELDTKILEAGQRGLQRRQEVTRLQEEFQERTPDDLSFVEEAGLSMARSIGPTIGAAAISAVSPAAAIALGSTAMAAGAAGSSYLNAEEIAAKRGIELTVEQKARFGALDGFFEGVGEAVGLKIALKAGLPFFERLAQAVVGESSSEAATAMMQKANEFFQLNPDMTAKEFAYEVALSATAGAMGGSVMAGAAHGAQKIGEAVQEDIQLRDAINDLLQSENPELKTPEEAALELLDPRNVVVAPEDLFREQLKNNPQLAARQASRIISEELKPATIAHQMLQAKEITKDQYDEFLKHLGEGFIQEIAKRETEGLQDIEREAQKIENELRLFAEAPQDHTPTETETADLDFASRIYEMATQQKEKLDFSTLRNEVIREVEKRPSMLLTAFLNMFPSSQRTALHPVTESRDFYDVTSHLIGPAFKAAAYLQRMALRQVNGYYPFSAAFSKQISHGEGNDLLWMTKEGQDATYNDLPGYGRGRALARMKAENKELAFRTINTLEAWLKKIAPAYRISVVDKEHAMQMYPADTTPGTRGWASHTGPEDGIIYVDESLDEAHYVEVLAHEFGHLISRHLLSKMPQHVKDAVDRAWSRDTYKMLRMSGVAAARHRRGPYGYEMTRGGLGMGPLMGQIPDSSFHRGYLFGKEEWVAHQLERLVTSDFKGMSTDAQTFFKRVLAQLKAWFKSFGSDFAPNKTFEDFIKLGALRARQQNAINEQMDAVEQMYKDFGLQQIDDKTIIEIGEYLEKTLDNIRASTKLKEEVLNSPPALQEKAAAAIKNLGQVETAMFTPEQESGVEISAEEWITSLEDAYLPGQGTNAVQLAASVESPLQNNSGLPTSKPASRIVSILKNFLKYNTSLRRRWSADQSQYQGHLDRYSWFKKQVYSLEQWAKINPHIEQLQRYVRFTREWAADRMAWISRADGRLRAWRKLTANEQKMLAKFLLDQTAEGKFFNLSDPAVLQKYPLTQRAREMYDAINSDFQEFISAVEATLIMQASKRLVANPFAASAEIQKIKERFNKLRKQPYFPLSRFGEYVITARATQVTKVNGKVYQPGEIIHFEAFDTQFAQLGEVDRIKGAYPTAEIKMDKVSEDVAALVGMPVPLIEALKSDSNIALTAQQKEAIDEFLYKIAPGQSFLKHMIKRKGLEGYSEDAMRSYADYFFHGASHLARIKHSEKLNDEVKAIKITADLITGTSVKRRSIANYMARHFRFIMQPENDWAALRGAASIAYLAAIPKTAFVNLTQVPLVTYPHLAAKYGDASAINALRQAYQDAGKMYHVTKPLTKAEEEAITRWSQGLPMQPGDEKIVRKWSGLESGERDMLRLAVQQGWIDESFAMELASMSEGSWLTRFKSTSKTGYYARTLAHYGMIPFQAAEKLNRRVTAIAAYRLAKQKGASFEVAFEAAREAVSATQYEYAKWNRPELLRGKKGVVFMFWQYMLNTLFFAFGGDKGWWRWWMIMLAAGGVMGLPFAGNLTDLATWIGQKLVGEDERFNAEYKLRKEAEKLGETLGFHPDILLHGASRFGFGMELLGDLSGTLSMGRPIPGTELLARSAQSWESTVTQGLQEAGGAGAALSMRMLQAALMDTADPLARWEKGVPFTFAQKVLGAVQAYRKGAIESHTGADWMKFDTNDPWDLTRIAFMALGFGPTELAQKRDEHFLFQDYKRFYTARREMLRNKLDEELERGDNQSIGEVMDAIVRFNKQVPSPSLAITGQQIRQMRISRIKGRTLTEEGIEPQKMMQDLKMQFDEGKL